MTVDLERLLANTLAIQRVPAQTFAEDQRAEVMHNAFLASGAASVDMDAAGNVYAEVPGGDEALVVVSAHLDTVFPPEAVTPGERRGNRLHGPGVGDNAVALAALIELAHDLPARRLDHDVILVANVAEEGLGNLLGMQHVVERFGDRPDAYIVIEGMALGHIYHQGLPVRRFRLSVRTEGGHAWIHAGRPSAIHSLMALGNELLAIPLDAEHRISLNIGRVHGGTSVNTIAGEASCEIDLRSTDEGRLQLLVDEVEKVVFDHDCDGGEVRLDAIGHRPGGGLDPAHPLIRAALAAATEAGIPSPTLETGSTDASLPLSLGLPAVCVGLTRGGGAHSDQEFIEIEPVAAGYQALRRLIAMGPALGGT